MLKELITPVRRSDFDTDAQYRRASREKDSILMFVGTVLYACWSMYKEHKAVEMKKRQLLDRIKPMTNNQAIKFIEFVNRKAFNLAKKHGGECCPRCGYWMFPIERNSMSADDPDVKAAPMKTRYCSMCGELIDRVYRDESELAQIQKYLNSLNEPEKKVTLEDFKESIREVIREEQM